MNAARLEKSDRLRRVLKLLKRVKQASTRDIVERAKVVAVSAAVAELRQQGHDITCQRRGAVWWYSLRAKA